MKPNRDIEKKLKKAQDDLQAQRWGLQKTNEGVKTLYKELEKRNIDLHKLMEERERRNVELGLFNKMSDAISYTIHYDDILRMMMRSLTDVIKFDIAASYLEHPEKSLAVYIPSPVGSKELEETKETLLKLFSHETNRKVQVGDCKLTEVKLNRKDSDEKPGIHGNGDASQKKKTEFHVPILASGELIGMIYVASFKGVDFGKDVRWLVLRLANQMSGAIERVRGIIASEKSKMESMVESMSEGVVMLDEKGEIAVLSPAARRMLSLDEHLTVTPDRLAEKLREYNLNDAFAESQSRQTSVVKEIVIPQEQSQVLSCEFFPVRQDNDRIIGNVMILRDVTRQRAADKAKSEFVSTVSHELRTPLTVIREGVSQVLDGLLGDVTTDQKEFLGMSLSAIDRLGGIINDLLDMSKIEAGRVEISRNLIDMAEVIRTVQKTFESIAQSKGLTIRTRVSSEKMYLYADRDKLIQVYTNLIGNALKFTTEGYIEISAEEKDGMFDCSVRDTGKGIAQADLPKVFGKFQQFGRKEGPGEKGTGLGLVISKALVELHHGTIGVESKRQKGTAFRFRIPRGSAEDVLRDHSENSIRACMKDSKPLSIVNIWVKNMDQITSDKESPQTQIEAMIKLGELVRSCLRRGDDAAVVGEKNIYVILPMTRSVDAPKIAQRIRQRVSEYHSKQRGVLYEMGFQVLSLPDDFHTTEQLLSHLSDKAPLANEVMSIKMIDQEIEISEQKKDPRGFCIIVMNILNLFQIRLSLGGNAYEEVISKVMDIVDKNVRGLQDHVVRTKLGQVMVLLPDTDSDGAYIVISKLSDVFHSTSFNVADQDVDIKVEFGVAHYPDDGKDTESLIRSADERIIRGKKILVVDDHPQIVKLLGSRIRARNGFKCVSASNGREGIELARKELPDLMILDVMMPEMNGYEVIGHLKEDPLTREIPIIILTAHKIQPDKVKAVSPGNIPVVTKSEGFDRLMDLVERLI